MNVVAMMMRALIVLALLALQRGTQDRWVPDERWFASPQVLNRPRDGFVTKKATAIAIGRAIIGERFGDEAEKNAGPFDAKRFGDVWVVYGFHHTYDLGGTVTVQISASTGTVLNAFAEH